MCQRGGEPWACGQDAILALTRMIEGNPVECEQHAVDVHGRSVATCRAAEHGASNQELKAVGGWSTDSQVGIYAAAVEQKRMAQQAMAPVIEFDLANRAKVD